MLRLLLLHALLAAGLPARAQAPEAATAALAEAAGPGAPAQDGRREEARGPASPVVHGIPRQAGSPGPRYTEREAWEPERILSALRDAYPGRIDRVARRSGDWAIRVGGEWYCWANGRLLPESEREEWERYDPVPFYRYPRELPPLARLGGEEKEALEARLKQREEDPPLRHSGFFDALWRIRDRVSSWERVKTIYFLGIKTEIHRDLMEDLAAVEEEIQALLPGDPQLSRYVGSLRTLDGYNWRRIDGTSSLSFHAYGAALDVIPAYYGGKQVYWRWAMKASPEWYSLPYENRFMPPMSFVQAFERHGFVWGGKWLTFDTIHFEYRPEVLLLNGFLPAP
jgi:hypothetical protein